MVSLFVRNGIRSVRNQSICHLYALHHHETTFRLGGLRVCLVVRESAAAPLPLVSMPHWCILIMGLL